jgi:putative lipoprotein
MPKLIDVARPLGVAALLAITGCATAPTRGPDITFVTLDVRLPAAAPQTLAPGHTLNVGIEEISRADIPARVFAETMESLNGRSPPWEAVLTFATPEIDPRYTYAVRATIRDADGNLVFVTDERHAVLTGGSGRTASITLYGPLQPR